MTTMRLIGLAYLSSVLGFAGTWSGALVDSNCFNSREHNVNTKDTLTAVDRDTRDEVQYCSATHKTKVFAVVPRQGQTFKLDPAGNAKAAQLMQKTGKKHIFVVDVTGDVNKDTLQVQSIAAAQ